MNRDSLLELYAYNVYANKLVLDTSDGLTEEEFVRESSPSRDSVRGLLGHMLAVEKFFLASCQEQPVRLGSDDFTTLVGIRQQWSELERRQQEFIAGRNESELAREIRIQMGDHWLTLRMWQMLVQAFVHSTHHRGELSIVLTGLGYPLPTLDIIIHHVRQSGQDWPWE